MTVVNHRRPGIFLLLLLVGTVTTLDSKAQKADTGQFRMTPSELQTLSSSNPSAPGSSNLSAVEEIVIAGDPAQPGLYTILLKVKPHTKIPAHLHPDQRIGTVNSGTWYFGYGDVFDQSKLKKLPPGSVYSEVKDQNHFAMTGNEAVIVEINGYGPSGVTYVDSRNDPKSK